MPVYATTQRDMTTKEYRAITERLRTMPLDTDEQKREALAILDQLASPAETGIIARGRKIPNAVNIVAERLDKIVTLTENRGFVILEKDTDLFQLHVVRGLRDAGWK